MIEARRLTRLPRRAVEQEARHCEDPRYFEVGRLSRESRSRANDRRREYANGLCSVMRERRQRSEEQARLHSAALAAAELEAVAEAATASARQSFAHSRGPFLRLTFHGAQLVSAKPFEQTLQLWDWTSGTRLRSMPDLVSEATFVSIATSGDGMWLASGDAGGVVHIHDAKSCERRCSLPSASHTSVARVPVVSVAFSPDGTLVAAGGATGLVSVWDVSGVLAAIE